MGAGWQIHKAITMAIKTFHYLYILANNGIDVHLLQIAQSS